MSSPFAWRKEERKIDLIPSIPFFTVHLACLLVFETGTSWVAVIVCVATYFLRAFGLTAGFHRYFSHRSFKTSRFFQFILGFLGTSAAQMGPIWWADHHRWHHQAADTEQDVHSPARHGFLWAHLGWVLCMKNYRDKERMYAKEWKAFPELVWLDNHPLVPPVILVLAMFSLGAGLEVWMPDLGTNGLQMMVWGYFISTVFVYHNTFAVNSICHLFGTRRFETKDTSRNNFWVALLTMGEGWHNNHHRYPSLARQGLTWWEVDASYVLLRLLARGRIVWDLRLPANTTAD